MVRIENVSRCVARRSLAGTSGRDSQPRVCMSLHQGTVHSGCRARRRTPLPPSLPGLGPAASPIRTVSPSWHVFFRTDFPLRVLLPYFFPWKDVPEVQRPSHRRPGARRGRKNSISAGIVGRQHGRREEFHATRVCDAFERTPILALLGGIAVATKTLHG